MLRTAIQAFAIAAFVVTFHTSVAFGQSKGGARGMCGPPPKAKPQRISGGESAKPPGGPSKLPCAPTRRTEKKMPPAPPTIAAKISFGANLDWMTDRNDIFNLTKLLGRQLQTPFRSIVVEFGYRFDPAETPIVYMSGHNAFKLDASKRRLMRDFIEGGGTLIMDACCGRKEFGESAKGEVRKMFPDRRFKRLPLDHPVFTAHHEIKRVFYTKLVTDRPANEPFLEGVDIGCRTAVFFTPYDLSCGWDHHTHPHSKGVVSSDAIKLGVNMLSYALVNRKQGETLAMAKAYTDVDDKRRGKVVLAQVKYSGEWNRHVSSTSNLLADLDKNFPADVKYERKDLSLTDPKLFSNPALFMTGHDEFKLTDPEVAALRKYLEGGGTLLAESCCGREDFDFAFRREMGRVLPKQKLKLLTPAHSLFKIGYDITKTSLPEHIAAKHSNITHPYLEGVDVKGSTAVIYSRYSLSCGWEEEDCKYCLGYDSEAAIKIGVNVLGYALSH